MYCTSTLPFPFLTSYPTSSPPLPSPPPPSSLPPLPSSLPTHLLSTTPLSVSVIELGVTVHALATEKNTRAISELHTLIEEFEKNRLSVENYFNSVSLIIDDETDKTDEENDVPSPLPFFSSPPSSPPPYPPFQLILVMNTFLILRL